MDNKKVGSFIAQLRKEKSMTQQDLADKLNVTSKAVSKWETGQGYPEITTIPILADILGVTTGELLNGEHNTEESNEMIESTNIINETVKYLDRTESRSKNIFILGISFLFLFSAFVCIICNYLINHVISWSLYPIGALIVLWTSIIPILKFKKFKAMGMLLGLTITVIPYLFLLEYLTPVKGWVVPLALPITIINLIALGIISFLLNHTKINKFYSASISVFIYGVIVDICIGKIINNFLENRAQVTSVLSTVLVSLASILISVVLFGIGYIRRDRVQ